MSKARIIVADGELDDDVDEPAHALVVTPRRIWVAVVSIVACALAIVVWLGAAQAPTVVTGNGLMLPPDGMVTAIAPVPGTVVAYDLQIGERIAAGQRIALIRPASGPDVPVTSFFAGELINGGRLFGDPVAAGDVVAEIVPAQGVGPVGTAGRATLRTTSVFVPIGQVAALTVGMPASVAVQQFPESQYGAIKATVAYVTPAPVSTRGLLAFAGENDSLLRALEIEQPVVQVDLALELDAGTPSGYSWTFGQGPPSGVLLVSTISMRAVAGREPLVPGVHAVMVSRP